MNRTANLQGRPLTVREAARLMNVSERMVYMARELRRTGRDDLFQAVKRGEMTLLAALRVAKPEKYGARRDGVSRLLNAWRAASAEDRSRFLAALQRERDTAGVAP